MDIKLPSQDALVKHLEVFAHNQKTFLDNCPPILQRNFKNVNRNFTIEDFVSGLTQNQVYLLLEIFDNFRPLK